MSKIWQSLRISIPGGQNDRWPGVYVLVWVVLFHAIGLPYAHATGTPAGTDITTQASVTYTVGTATLTANSNVLNVRVVELLDASVVWQDASNIIVHPADSGQVLTFILTNTGNGSDSFTLTGLSTLSGDDFDPLFANIYLDTNGNSTFDAGIDLQYIPAANDPVLAADSSVTIFLLNDIPSGLKDGDLGNSELKATSNTGTGAPGDAVPGAGEAGTDAVIGPGGGIAAETGIYAVSTVVLSLVKSATILDPFGGSEPVPGALITYTILIEISGSGTANNIVITDPIPINTTYNTGTLRLNTATLTDIADGDAGDVGETNPGVITVSLGDLAGTAPTQTIMFDVTID